METIKTKNILRIIKPVKSVVLGIAASVLVFSCNLKETNINPNVPSDASVNTLLPGAQLSLSFAQASQLGPYVSIYDQHFAGNIDFASTVQNYTVANSYFNDYWSALYPGTLYNLKIIINKSKASGLPYYSGISRILFVVGIGTATDVFGDIPYSDALTINTSPLPKYDRQQDIYTNIQIQLDSAIQELSKPKTANLGGIVPSSDDVIFKGDVSKWIAAAWTLKARYALHLSKIDKTDAATKALAYASKGISSNAGDLAVTYTTAPTTSNPIFQYGSYRPNWIVAGKAIVNLLNGNEATDPGNKTVSLIDPRRSYLINPAGGKYVGLPTQGVIAFSTPGSFVASRTSQVIFTSFIENKLIEAEARLILSDGGAQLALQDAVRASFNKIVSDPADTNATEVKRTAYINAKAVLTGDYDKDLKTIITQKYISLYSQPESWVDYRRTGYPQLSLLSDGDHASNPGGGIPRRLPYPQNEEVLNSNIPTKTSNHQVPQLWWDK
ncbi:SusD/RagB family nutrient-binding outer membrane lipoprotein [Sporocytophaga myxococcoides]|uniref:SusD/RagB family nutrient-binding outer membrane lipoprotein n=1 Tax=Sporocytophaga myxococcoides TaxID=153721 RepID=UPI0004094DE1|nr:SusD/RagB family nutrient-binding outer membrane lipoprotein [Sporocytophaga myxococcoides]